LKVTEPGVLTVAVIKTAVPYVPVEAPAGKLKDIVGVIFEIADVIVLVAEALPAPLVTVIVADIALPTSSTVKIYVDVVAPEIGVPSRFQVKADVGVGIPVTPLDAAVNVWPLMREPLIVVELIAGASAVMGPKSEVVLLVFPEEFVAVAATVIFVPTSAATSV
jgi:hypothetical protein